MNNKIYAVKRDNQYFVSSDLNPLTNKLEATTSRNVNRCKLMTKEEVRQVLEDYPDFQVAIINTIN